jgi:hypothetical protein
MIFYNEQTTFESEKERNLYYKIFAGYIFNEFIPGYDKRIKLFVDVLQEARYKGPNAQEITYLDVNSVRVSFDNHIYLLKSDSTDRGEFADILIHDSSTKTIIAIEAKLYDDWSYLKDIKQNSERHDVLRNFLGNPRIIPVLLVTENKWNECRKQKGRLKSNYNQLEGQNTTFRVICWEDLFPVVSDNEVVLRYMQHRLKIVHKNNMRVGKKDGWFYRFN